MRFKAVLVLLAAFILLTACQSTPDKTVIVNKADGKLEETIHSTPAPVKPATEETAWNEQYDIPGLKCDINAQITLPDTNKFPVYKVKQSELSTELADKVIKYFTAGATGVRKTSDTKEELTAQLVAAKRGMYVEDDNGARWEPYEGQEQRIAELEEQIENAPEETFQPIQDSPSTIPFNNTYAMSSGSRVYINAVKRIISVTTVKYGVVQGESWLKDGGAIPGEPAGTTIEDIKISKEDALEKLNALVSELGIKDYGIVSVEKARIVYRYTAEVVSKGWQFILTRNDGNSIPVDLNAQQAVGLLDFRSEDYAERWGQDTITVFIDETGFRYFYWTDPIDVVEIANENVSLLPFEDIKERIRSSIKFGYSKSVEAGWVNGENSISVDKVVLANVLIPVKDDPKHQMLVPAWLVYYKYYIYYESKLIDEWPSVFAVNAIDGSSIDLTIRPPEAGVPTK